MMIRVLSFVGVVLVGLFLPFWFFVPVAFIYALMFRPIEVLILAVCIDAQFGDVEGGIWYAYTLAGAGILIVTASMKPYLRFYE